jgi:hypothetical protein
MFRFYFILIISFNLLYSYELDIRQLQDNFYNEVVKVNIYKNYYDKYLSKLCEDGDIKCYINKIDKLENWESTKANIKLQTSLRNRKQRTYLSSDYKYKLAKKLNKYCQDEIFKNTQFVSVVDLNRQLFIVLLYIYDENTFYIIGSDLISSGNINREAEVKKGADHYLKTPSGIFKITKGWRSNGKYNLDKKTLSYGSKGRFIYYLGKYDTIRYNTFDKNGTKIIDKNKWQLITDKLNFAIHSHKSTAKMGKPYSHGCIRMTNELNYFLDTNLVLHKNFFKQNRWILKYAKKPKHINNPNLFGEYIIIFDKI